VLYSICLCLTVKFYSSLISQFVNSHFVVRNCLPAKICEGACDVGASQGPISDYLKVLGASEVVGRPTSTALLYYYYGVPPTDRKIKDLNRGVKFEVWKSHTEEFREAPHAGL
jgi:hypothetical protein